MRSDGIVPLTKRETTITIDLVSQTRGANDSVRHVDSYRLIENFAQTSSIDQIHATNKFGYFS